jgi:hypothetical protein
MAKFNGQKFNKQDTAAKVAKKYVLNKPIAQSIVSDVVDELHKQGFVLVDRKRMEKLQQLEQVQ